MCVHMCLQKERVKVCVPVSVHTRMRVGPPCRHVHIGVFAGVHSGRRRADFVGIGVYVYTGNKRAGVCTCRCAHMEQKRRLGV